MTRGILLRAFAGLAGVFLIGTALAACAASPTHVAAPLTAGPSTPPSSTIATTPTTSAPAVATTHPRPKPKPSARPTAPRTTAPQTSSAPPPVTTKPASPRPVTTTPAPPRTTAQAAPPPKPSNCDPAYPGVCLKDGIGDYDCAGGSGNGPNYVNGPITVRAPDPFGLDSDHDGVGCE